MKLCRGCEETKPVSDFYANKRNSDGLQSWCRACTSAASKRWRERDPDAFRQSSLSSEERRQDKRWEERIAALGPPVRCAICGERFEAQRGRQSKAPNYDHNHETGTPRGWLCNSCNTSLGKFGDNPKLLERARDYLVNRGFSVTKPVLS